MFYIRKGIVFLLIFGLSVWLTSVHLAAQPNPTLLKQVVVSHQLDGEGAVHFDSVLLSVTRGGDLSDLIKATGPLMVKDYGPGQLSSPSFRGANASQTPLVWNGLRINNPMLAQFDLSLIPAGIIESGGVLFGPATLRYASGAAGGVISIRTDLPADTTPRVHIDWQGGSFGYRSGQGLISFGKGGFFSATRVYRTTCDNRFPFPDNYQGTRPWPTALRSNASWLEEGLMQQIGYASDQGVGNVLHIWLYRKFNQVPYPIQQPQGKYRQDQEEEGVRLLLENRYRSRGAYVFRHSAGYQNGWMHYVEERSATDALHKTVNFQEAFSVSGPVRNAWVTLQSEWEWQGVETEYYGSPVQRTLAAGFAEVSGDLVKKLKYRVISRLEWVSGSGWGYMPSAILTYTPDSANRQRLALRLMRDRRLPGLNDLYWYPGGNPTLGAERSVGMELLYNTNPLAWGSVSVMPELTLFRQMIEDKITWLPDTGALWSAVNQGSVRMQGISAMIRMTGKIAGADWSAMASYQYCKASPFGEDFKPETTQLIYQPFHTGLITASIRHKGLTGVWDTGITGKRYTNAANTSWLNGYSLSGLKLQYAFKIKGMLQPGVSASVGNLFNRQYQAIAWYPMPGRYFRVGLSMDFKSTGKSKLNAKKSTL